MAIRVKGLCDVMREKSLEVFLILIVVCCGHQVASAEVRPYGEVEVTQYNDLREAHVSETLSVKLDVHYRDFRFIVRDGGGRFRFDLYRAQADSLIRGIDKYLAWFEKAATDEVTLEKKIRNVGVRLTAWGVGGDWYWGPKSSMRLTFLSFSTTDHRLVVSFPRVTSLDNEYMTYLPEPLYFDLDAAIELRRLLSPQAVAGFLEEVEDQRAIERGFR